jgi:D-cysteine desulfhydrase family pyridoxal phosphate-dependent enzyme
MLTLGVSRVPIALLPTPVAEMKRLSAELGGPRLFIKRDDQTGLATGGNKARKLEYLIADALQQGADTVLTVGGPQSNHSRQTAAAAAMYGLRAVLVLSGSEPLERDGNLLLDDLLGAEVRWVGDRPLQEAMEQVASEEEKAGHRTYPIPLGGSTPLGVTGYVAAMEELWSQLDELGLELEAIIVPTGSAGTQAGLLVGGKALGFRGQIVGISAFGDQENVKAVLRELVPGTAAFLGLDVAIGDSDLVVYDDYLGDGYGVLADTEREAIRLVARSEGILLDPVYTGRAMAGLLDLIQKGVYRPGQRVLFWHTGGTSALFSYAADLMRGVR